MFSMCNSAPYLIVAGLAWQVAEGALRVPTHSYVDPGVDALEARSAEAVVSGLNEKTRGAVLSAQAAASRAQSAYLRAEELSTQSQMKRSELQDMLTSATASGENAALSSEQAVDSLKHMQAFAAQAVEESKGLAVKAVQDMFAYKFQELEPWRQNVLTDPYQKGQNARAAALRANDGTLRKLYGRIGTYQAGMQPMQEEAKRLIANAGQLASIAQSKTSYDPWGASQDMQAARNMQMEGAELAKTSQALHASVSQMNEQVEATLAARSTVGDAEDSMANPNSFPPLPVNPDYSYAPPR